MDDAKLKTIATGVVAYEVRTLFGQLDALAKRKRAPSDPVYLALVEAPLVHLRLLDEFLGCKPPKPGSKHDDDVVAKHYNELWTPRGFLSKDERIAINGQLQHLVSRRRAGYDWYFLPLATQFATRFMEFVEGLSHVDWERADWFRASVDECLWLDDVEDRFPNVASGS